jgi:hypothetical protein
MPQERIGLDIETPREKPRSRIRAWGLLIFFSILIVAFGSVIGPWIQNNIPTMRQIVQVIEERDIDSAAYFYTEIEASDDGEQYLRESIRFSGHKDARLNFTFLSGVAICIIILLLGYRFLPND